MVPLSTICSKIGTLVSMIVVITLFICVRGTILRTSSCVVGGKDKDGIYVLDLDESSYVVCSVYL